MKESGRLGAVVVLNSMALYLGYSLCYDRYTDGILDN